jgi:indolepyruvate ferredoxin oxidoreductase alpha subunit
MKEFLLGNEAIARGAWEGGVKFASGYPGTPSTEILETLARQYPEVDAQWSANEKVAFEEGMGAAIGGLRVLVTMKMVGLNVAADSFMVFPYSGTNGGFVVISADDPGMHSSQNEQDNRYLALMAKVPVLEPSTAQECKDFIKLGMEISEQFSVPVMMRTTTRLAHHKGLVELGERVEAHAVTARGGETHRRSPRICRDDTHQPRRVAARRGQEGPAAGEGFSRVCHLQHRLSIRP